MDVLLFITTAFVLLAFMISLIVILSVVRDISAKGKRDFRD